jgi:hypothetical protein
MPYIHEFKFGMPEHKPARSISFHSSLQSTEACQEGKSARDPSEKIMTPCTFSIKFPYDIQFTFSSLMFAAEEDENLELLTRGASTKASYAIL